MCRSVNACNILLAFFWVLLQYSHSLTHSFPFTRPHTCPSTDTSTQPKAPPRSHSRSSAAISPWRSMSSEPKTSSVSLLLDRWI